jgi:hypothetical protein
MAQKEDAQAQTQETLQGHKGPEEKIDNLRR